MTLPPVVKTLHVDLPPADAFDLFTARIGEWWPVETHSVSSDAGKASQALEMGQGVGDDLVETAHDGTRHVWGKIQEWVPGTAFAMTWHPGRVDSAETQVRVTFEAEGRGTTVTLTHSNWEVLGESASRTRNAYDSGWDPVMARYGETVLA